MSSNRTVRIITILDYVGFLCLLGLFIEKDNEDVRFHTNQGLILFIVEIVVSLLSLLLGLIPFVGRPVGELLRLFCLVLMILGILHAVYGVRRPLPLIGRLATFIK